MVNCQTSCSVACSGSGPVRARVGRRVSDAVRRIEREYSSTASSHWVLGFSGGKDSSLLLRALFHAVSNVTASGPRVDVVYCDTGVELPPLAQRARATIAALGREARDLGLPISGKIVRPRMKDRYFVKVIGRGYPPPTSIFRWCTDRLRVEPISRHLGSVARPGDVAPTVLVGVRSGESRNRDQAIARYRVGKSFYLEQSRGPWRLFAPILPLSVPEVWNGVFSLNKPAALDASSTWELYRDADGECSPSALRGDPCSSARMGCWTCTVVSRDRSGSALVAAGHRRLAPLLEFRDWLSVMRDLPENRASLRRNGQPGPGPLTLSARGRILQRLRLTEARSGYRLLWKREEEQIRMLWARDREDLVYRE